MTSKNARKKNQNENNTQLRLTHHNVMSNVTITTSCKKKEKNLKSFFSKLDLHNAFNQLKCLFRVLAAAISCTESRKKTDSAAKINLHNRKRRREIEMKKSKFQKFGNHMGLWINGKRNQN